MGAPPRLWGIADLHLTHARPDRHERFAARWREQAEKTALAWREAVAPGDLVFLAGDVSMARGHREVQPDLHWLGGLPGTKVLCPGNHDAWFNDLGAVRKLLRRDQRAVDGDALALEGAIVCGARSAPTFAEGEGTSDPAILARAVERLRAGLAQARALRKAGASGPIVALWHHPPFDRHGGPGPAARALSEGGADFCLFGHLHAQVQAATTRRGRIDGAHYECVASEAIGGRPLRLRWSGTDDASDTNSGPNSV